MRRVSLMMFAALTPLTAAPALAQEPPLETVVVTGERYGFGAQKIVEVTAVELAQVEASDLEEVFARDPSVRVGGGAAAAQKIYVRGVEDKLLHISIDGAPQGGYLSHHHGQYLLEPELLKRVEVEPGPGGAVQGPGALAGAVRFETKDPRDFLGEGERYGAFAKAGWFSNAQALRLSSAAYGEVSDALSLLGAFSSLDADDYEDGRGAPVDYTAHRQKSGFVKAVATLAQDQRLSFSAERLEDAGTYRHRPNFAGYFNHPLAPNIPVAMELERTTATLGYRAAGWRNELEATAHYTNTEFQRAGQYEMGYRSAGLQVRRESRLDRHTLRYGADVREDRMSFTGRGSITGAVRTLVYRTIPDETVRIAGAYLQDDWRALEPLEVSFGARFDQYDYQDKDGGRYEDAGVSPTLGASYRLTDALQLNASHGRAFRGVTVIDAITANEGAVRNAAHIEPERAHNSEVGFQFESGPIYLSGTLYRQRIKDVIVDADNDGVRGNEGELAVDGYDLTAALTAGALFTSVAVSESDPELNGADLVDTSFGLGASFGRTWNGYVGYGFAAARLEIGWSLAYVEAYRDTPPGVPGKPSYVVHGAHAQWSPLDNDALSVTLAAHNLFDEFYVDQATSGYNSQLRRVAGLPEPGRDVRLSLAYSF